MVRGGDRLDDIVTRARLTDRAWFKPCKWIVSSGTSRDVYDPENDALGSGLLQKTAASISCHNRHVNDVRESMR